MMRTNLAAIGLGLAAASLLGCAGTGTMMMPPSSVPDALKVPPGQTLSLRASAKGVQIYACRAAKDDAARYEWTLKAPEAELYDGAGKRVGKHYAGPTWEAGDGSKVVGEVKAKDSGPDPGSIPWLLLNAKSTEGSGVFAGIRSVQRLETAGGKAPPEGCDAGHAGAELRVPYTATYYFYSEVH